ncbi:SMP-30/gluconolactonase/LRE family protein [Sulfitobacter sp. LCG007]
MQTDIFDDRPCALGEGPLWHPERRQLYWFDITGQRLLSREGTAPLEWQLDEMCSAAGWIDRDTLLMASATGLWRFDIASGAKERVAALEDDNAGTRSNDGRADPLGGFWIGTMGLDAEPEAGAIYRYYRGELRRLYDRISIPNAICFPPGRGQAYFADTARQTVWRVQLDSDGWPKSEREVFLDLREEDLFPDGAVCDAQGRVWIAQWGAARVACYGPDGRFQAAIPLSGRHSSCPAFGGAGLGDLFVTTARQGLAESLLEQEPENGTTFVARNAGNGQREHRVIL